MIKIAILGTENSHPRAFVRYVKEYFTDVEIVGVYGDDDEQNKYYKDLGFYVAKDVAEFKGKVDAVLITARHGDKHLKYAMPYFEEGICMFVDKPFTISEEDALCFLRLAKENNCPICGGSLLREAVEVKALKKQVEQGEDGPLGKVISASIATPLVYFDNCGEFFFYSQHLVDMMFDIFGTDVRSVQAFECEKTGKKSFIIKYDDFNISAHYGTVDYTITIHGEKGTVFKKADYETEGSKKQFQNFLNTIRYKKAETSIEDMIKPVFVLSAMNRALLSKKEEKVNTFSI